LHHGSNPGSDRGGPRGALSRWKLALQGRASHEGHRGALCKLYDLWASRLPVTMRQAHIGGDKLVCRGTPATAARNWSCCNAAGNRASVRGPAHKSASGRLQQQRYQRQPRDRRQRRASGSPTSKRSFRITESSSSSTGNTAGGIQVSKKFQRHMKSTASSFGRGASLPTKIFPSTRSGPAMTFARTFASISASGSQQGM
jgi:hypothetical protein